MASRASPPPATTRSPGPAHVGFAVFDMLGRLHHDGGGGTAPMASTFKVMLMVAYLRQDSVDDRPLNDYDKVLMRPMIRRSDNTSATRIRDMLGQDPIEALADRARMKDFQWNSIWGYCRTSARDQAFFMRTLRRYVPHRHWDFARRQLAHIVPWQRWGVGQVDPDGWKLYFKGGWGSGSGAVDHQVALLAARPPQDRRRRPDRGQPLARLRQGDARGRLPPPASRPARASAGRRAGR